MTTRRLVAVLGYSNGGSSLHAVCAERLRRAEAEARPGDLVLLSGWSRRRCARSEAALMAEAWRRPDVQLVVGADARTTAGNAVDALRTAVAHDVDEVVVVTSHWHARRAGVLFRAAFRNSRIALSVVGADGTAASTLRARELGLRLFTPVQARVLRRRVAAADL